MVILHYYSFKMSLFFPGYQVLVLLKPQAPCISALSYFSLVPQISELTGEIREDRPAPVQQSTMVIPWFPVPFRHKNAIIIHEGISDLLTPEPISSCNQRPTERKVSESPGRTLPPPHSGINQHLTQDKE